VHVFLAAPLRCQGAVSYHTSRSNIDIEGDI
jgi:hypothetical protein